MAVEVEVAGENQIKIRCDMYVEFSYNVTWVYAVDYISSLLPYWHWSYLIIGRLIERLWPCWVPFCFSKGGNEVQ